MNPQRTHTLTHFGPLFITALGGWMAFNLANSGTLYVVPGVIVAALLAYGGTLVALRMQAARDLRTSYSADRTTGRFSTRTIATARTPTQFTLRPAFDDIDIAVGD